MKPGPRPGLRRAVFLTTLALTAPVALPGQVDGAAAAWGQADSSVAIGDTRIGLRVVAWRDFLPRVGPDRSGSGLLVNLQIARLDSTPWPEGLKVDSAWVRSPGGVWSTAPSSEPRPGFPNGLDLMLRGGPKWPTEHRVAVLVRLRTAAGKAHYLQARGQRIGRTQ